MSRYNAFSSRDRTRSGGRSGAGRFAGLFAGLFAGRFAGRFAGLLAGLLAGSAVLLTGFGSQGFGIENLETSVARADRANPLDGQPPVRHRKLMVKKRLELTAAFESTINADYKHTIGGGLKLEYHLSDSLSIGGVGIFGTSRNTGLSNKIRATLPDTAAPEDPDPTPTKNEFSQHLNKMPAHGAAYISITPWYGKLAAFGKAFLPFDFYFQAGISFASLDSNCDPGVVCTDRSPAGDPDNMLLPDNNPNDDPPLNDGFKAGLYLGGGIHVYVSDYIALDFTIRDYVFSDNPSGLDFDADLKVENEDRRFMNHIFMGVGISILLPTKVKRTP